MNKQEEKMYFKYKKEYENEAQIKDNCEIRINDELIPFSYFYKFNKKVNICLNQPFELYEINYSKYLFVLIYYLHLLR